MKIRQHKLLLLPILGILVVSGCGEPHSDSSAPVEEQKEFPSQEGWNSTYRISRAGRPQAVIRYGHMSQYDSRKTTYFDEGVIVDFFDETGRHSSKLTSDRGIYNIATNDVYGVGNVVVVSDTGVTLYTEKIRWDQTREKIISDTLVTVVTEDSDTLYGRGFESMPDLSKMVFKEIRGTTGKRLDMDRIKVEMAVIPEPDSLAVEESESPGDTL
jgi:LPS export ABC transporter protein LptC